MRYLSVVPGMAMVGSASCWASALEMAEMPTVRERVLVLVFFCGMHTHKKGLTIVEVEPALVHLVIGESHVGSLVRECSFVAMLDICDRLSRRSCSRINNG